MWPKKRTREAHSDSSTSHSSSRRWHRWSRRRREQPRSNQQSGRRPTMFAPAPTKVTINGFVRDGFEAVRAAFADNFEDRHELGGACCAYYRGEKVVDLWGGIRNKQTGEPWERDTMVLVYSATK